MTLKLKPEELEDEATKELGYIIFEFSRLDTDLALCLVWANQGKDLAKFTKILTEKGQSFNFRLELLEDLTKKNLNTEFETDEYRNWIEDAHQLRQLRNRLVHGRWGFIPSNGTIANVLGLPTSKNQDEQRYSIDDLRNYRTIFKDLREKLAILRNETRI